MQNKVRRINRKVLKKYNKVFVAFFIKVIGVASSLLTSIIISRCFSSSGVGIYSLSNSIISICLILSKFGFDIAIIKYISIDYNKKEYGDLHEKLKTICLISTVIALTLSLIIAISASALGELFGKENLGQLLRIMIWVLVPDTLVGLLAATFKAVKRTYTGLIFESVSVNSARCILLILLVIILGNHDIEWVGYTYIIAACLMLLIAYALWKRFTKNWEKNKSEHYSFRPVVKTAYPLLLVNSTNYILNTTDILMIGYLLPASEVGIYNIATKITLFSTMLLGAINALLGPRFAVLYKNEEKEKLSHLVKKASRLMFVGSITITVLLFVLAKPILSIWGEEFVAGTTVLYISLIGQFFVLSTGPLATLLMMCGFEKIHRNNTIFCAILNIILNAILIPKIGIAGAAVASTISLAIKNTYCIYAVKKRLGFFCY